MTRSTPTTRDTRTAVDKAMSLLNAFGDDAYTGVGVSELARRSSLSKSTAFRLLATLQNNGAVERAGNNYRLGKMIQDLGSAQEDAQRGRMRDALTPFLADLYELSKQTVHLAVLEGSDVVYLNKLYGHLQVRSPSRIGGRAPGYCTAVGKVLLAYNPGAADLAVESGMVSWTPSTLTDPDSFRQELLEVRRTNLAYDREEILVGLNCVAAPVFGPNGRPVAAMSVSGPVGKFIPGSQATALRKVCYAASRAVAAISGQQHQGRRQAAAG